MSHGRDFRRAIDRLAADLTRIAERAIAIEVERAIALAIPLERKSKRSASTTRSAQRSSAAAERKARAAERRAARAALRAERFAAKEAERKERETERLRRKSEREQLRQELKSARDAARQAKITERNKAKQESLASREARHRALTEKAVTPPPLVVFKRSRDGQVTVLQPRAAVENEAAPQAPATA
ncbi:MAG TPA: hypothetical protein VG937_27495 [Polyangiaceae bacterium]|jgi:hypothetical protein|nr:hypothetical protein [Polyangiaceae bacterium]